MSFCASQVFYIVYSGRQITLSTQVDKGTQRHITQFIDT